MTGCTFAQAPCIFIFAGASFMLVMILSDTCQSYANLGLRYLDSYPVCSTLWGQVRDSGRTLV